MRLTGTPGRLAAALAERGGCDPAIEQLRSRPWASVSFTGARHRLTLRLSGEEAREAADRIAEGLEEAEFDLGPDLLVDIAVVEREDAADEVSLTIEALTVDAD